MICECQHHKWSHNQYYPPFLDNNDNCLFKDCECKQFKERQFRVSDQKYPCVEALRVRLALNESKMYNQIRYIQNQERNPTPEYSIFGVKQHYSCPECYDWFSLDDVDGYTTHMYHELFNLEHRLETKFKDLVSVYEQLKQSDIEHERNERIKFKSHQTCKLFRCLKCWKYILPDDSILAHGDGYIHGVCDGKHRVKGGSWGHKGWWS